MKETSEEKSFRLKRAVTVGHRKRFGLCIRCGKNPHDGFCEEDYIRSDTRVMINENSKELDLIKKKNTIISYRKRKKLCLKCGREYHNGTKCTETYEQADNRTDIEKKERPAIVPSSKDLNNTIIKPSELKELKIQLKKTENIKLQRQYIVLCIHRSKHDNIVEFSCLNQLSKKYQSYIICIIGDLEKTFPYSDMLKIKRFPNIKQITGGKQEIINYLWNCKKFLSFQNDYVDYCQNNLIPVYVFDENKNATNFLKDSAFLD